MPVPTIFLPDFLTRHNLLQHLYRGLSARTPSAPLTDARWDALAPILADQGSGFAEDRLARPHPPRGPAASQSRLAPAAALFHTLDSLLGLGAGRARITRPMEPE